MKSVIVYSGSSVLSQGLRVVLANNFHVLGLFESLEELEHQLLTANPDLLVIEMTPGISHEQLRYIGTIARKSYLIIWTDAISPEFVSACLSLGIRGVLSKSAPAEAYVQCLTQVASGGLWIDQALSIGLLNTRKVHLTPRERQMVGLLVQGLSNKEIAWALAISQGTVKVYLSRLFPKVGVCDRFELALLALKNLPDRSEITPGRDRQPGIPAMPIAFPGFIWISSGPSGDRSMFIPESTLQIAARAEHAIAKKALSPLQSSPVQVGYALNPRRSFSADTDARAAS